MEAEKKEEVVDWRLELVRAVREVAEGLQEIKKEIGGIREEMIVVRKIAEKREEERCGDRSSGSEECSRAEEWTESERESDTGDEEKENQKEGKEGRKQEEKTADGKTDSGAEAERIAEEIKKLEKRGWFEMMKEEDEQKEAEKAEEEKQRRAVDEKKEREKSDEERTQGKGWKVAVTKTEERKEERRRRAEQREKDERWREEQEERRKRKKNVMLRGEVEVKEIEIQGIQELLKEGLGKEMEIEKIVKKKQIGGDGLVIVEMKDEKDKKELWERRREMEAVGAEVCEDLTWWERKTRYKMREKVNEERKKGKKAWIENRKLIVDGREIEFDERTERWKEEEEGENNDDGVSTREEASEIQRERGEAKKAEERRKTEESL